MTDQDINDLLKVFDNPCHCYPLNVVEAIRLLVKQRDEARRWVCRKTVYAERKPHDSVDSIEAKVLLEAQVRGWNCFDAPHANTTDVSVQNGGA